MKSTNLVLFLLITAVAASAAIPATAPASAPDGNDNSDMDGVIFGGGGGFNIPGLGPISGFIKPSFVCRVKGPCYMKRLKCPRKCFKSFGHSGKGYGYGGGGGGCTVDCEKKCIAYC